MIFTEGEPKIKPTNAVGLACRDNGTLQPFLTCNNFQVRKLGRFSPQQGKLTAVCIYSSMYSSDSFDKNSY